MLSQVVYGLPNWGPAHNPRHSTSEPFESSVHTYRLRVAFRDRLGIVRPPVRDETIQAVSLRAAIGALLSDADSLLVADTNLVWLTDREENLLWTLRMDEQNAETT